MAICIATAFSVNAAAQDFVDLTSYYLENSLFDDNFNYTASQTGNVGQEMLAVDGWTNDYSMGYTIVGVYQIGTKKTYNGASVPSKNVDGTTDGGVLALSTGWTESLKLFQTVTLPAGTYKLVSAYYNGDASQTGGSSLFGWIPNSGTSTMSKVTSFAVGKWVTDTLTFTLAKTTTGKIQIGIKAVANGSANSAKIGVDYVKLFGKDMDVDKSELLENIKKASAQYADGKGNGAAALKAVMDKAQSVADNANADVIAVLEAVKALEEAISAYRLLNVSEENPLDKTAYITNPSFENGTTGWITESLASQNNSAFSKKAGTYYMEKWTGSGAVGNGYARQVISDLPVGIYKLTVGAQNYSESATTKKNTGAYIFADNQRETVYTPADYSVKFTNITGNVEIGFVADGATGNWIAVDNFRLYLIGELSTEGVMAEVKRLIDEAGALEIPAEIAPSYQRSQELTDALAAAALLTEASSATEIGTVITALQAAVSAEQEAIEKALFAYRIANATPGTGTAPQVTATNHYVATGATQALMRATMAGSNILERGVCWSTEHNPTVQDERTTKYFSLKGMLFHIKGLKPATVYYLRPYVMNTTYMVAYGDEVKIVTHPKGTCTGSWDEGAPDEAANARCRKAIEETIEYFNEWTGIKGFHLSGHYGAQTPTADCSYGGWMRIGPNAGNQAIGTVLHETGHGVGVGTHWRWYDCSDTRESTTRGKWLGREANDVLHFLENNYDSNQVYFTGDGTHGWGWGANNGSYISYDWLVNGADKDKHQEQQYIGGMCILHGLFIDGLCPTTADANGIAGYTYNFDDSKKYYLMSKNVNCGRGTGLLRQLSSTNVGWTNSLTDETLSDSIAWKMEFVPTSGYYLFKNVATGRYLSHGSSSSLITAKNVEKASSSEYFQLMPDRTDVTIGKGSAARTTHGYWFTWEDSGSKAMSANVYREVLGYGSVLSQDFNFSNAATSQQWIIISEDELADYRAIATVIEDIHASTAADEQGSAAIYDLQGRRVDNPTKGVYIINGRKVVIK